MLRPTNPWSAVETSRVVEAVPDAIFAVLADPLTYPDWLVGAQRIRDVDADFPTPGAGFAHSVGLAPGLTIDDTSAVTAVDAPHRLSLRVRVGLVEGAVDLLIALTPGGSEVRFRERPVGLPAVATPLLRFAIHRRNVESLRQLAELVEARTSLPAG